MRNLLAIILLTHAIPADSEPSYCPTFALMRTLSTQAKTLAEKLGDISAANCPEDARQDGQQCPQEPLKPPEPNPDDAGKGCKTDYDVDSDKDVEVAGFKAKMKYSIYRTKTPQSPKKTIVYLCGGPSACDGVVPTFAPPGYDVIVFDPPGLGKNRLGVDAANRNADAAARVAVAIIKKEQASMGEYVIAGQSWGSRVATATAGELGDAPKPKSVLLDGVLAASEDHSGRSERFDFGEMLPGNLQALVNELGSFFQPFIAAHYMNLSAKQKESFAKLKPEELKACLKSATVNWDRLHGEQCQSVHTADREMDDYRESAICKSRYDPKAHKIAAEIPINYLSGEKDGLTPPQSAQAHAVGRTNPKEFSLFKGCGHSSFTLGQLKCEVNGKIWEGAFTGAVNFSSLVSCAPADSSANPDSRDAR